MSEHLTTIRRQDRAVEDAAWIRAFLRRAPVGTLATAHDGQPFIHINLFVYDETAHCVYLHTARTGRTPGNLAANSAVCFSVMEMGRLLPADVALEFSVEYASVIVFGRAALVEEEDEAARALQLLLDKYAPHLRPGQDYRPPIDSEIKRTAVFRIAIEAWSGKKKEAAADFPGAYWYAETPVLASRVRRDDKK
jgi:nitroimidazol reductase NimA-like FMN-containing flavoprotein (pyridoxamine 5'-phosphate oxidase superfamily)